MVFSFLNFMLFSFVTLSSSGDSDQQFLAAAQRNLLTSTKCSRSQSASAANYRADARTLAAAEDPSQQSTRSRSDYGVLDALAASSA
jgi:hypothetical protein